MTVALIRLRFLSRRRRAGLKQVFLFCRRPPLHLLFPHRCFRIPDFWRLLMKTPCTLGCAAVAMVMAAIMLMGAPANTLPSQISDAEFWRMVTEFSEPTGIYPYENFVGTGPPLRWTAACPRIWICCE